jgi:hypothetical protein
VEGKAEAFEQKLGELAAEVSQRSGLVGLHVLHHEAPQIAVTTEQRIRGNADRAADWVILACGYDLAALRGLDAAELSDTGLLALGAAASAARHFYELAYSATPTDVH